MTPTQRENQWSIAAALVLLWYCLGPIALMTATSGLKYAVVAWVALPLGLVAIVSLTLVRFPAPRPAAAPWIGVFALGFACLVPLILGTVGVLLFAPSAAVTALAGRALFLNFNSDPRACEACGYDLTGAPSRTCPECGFVSGVGDVQA